VIDDGPHGDVTDEVTLEMKFINDAIQRSCHQALVGDVAVVSERFGKRGPSTAKNGHRTESFRHKASLKEIGGNLP
jgi:hypothetical protein